MDWDFAILVLLGVGMQPIRPLSIVIIVIGSLLLIGYSFLFPNSYRIDKNGITVYYVFGIKTTAKWNELRTVEDHYCRVFPWMREYHIGYFKNTMVLWEEVCIPENKKTTTLIEKYYKNRIEKYG